MAEHSSLIITIAGVSIFMYGMSLASDHLEKLAANRIRDIITTLAKQPIWGVFLGMVLTVILQSSGAVTSMLVGLGSARVVTLPQVMSVILGTAIGSTFTVQIISFNVAQYGLPLFAFSFLVYFLSRSRTLTHAMAVGMGFGLIFWGMELIAAGTNELRHIESFGSLLSSMSANPFYCLVLTAIITALLQSSAITIGFAMSLASAGLITLDETVYWVFGANVGTTATALVASIGGNYVGRQVAWAHCFYKLTSVLLFFPFAHFLSNYFQTANVGRDIANIHTAYNLLAAVLYYPFIKQGANLVAKLFPPNESEKEYSVRYIHKGDWESPSVVLAHAEREVMRMADVVQSMIEDSLKVFRRDDPDLVESIRLRDDRVDLLNREINLYLAQHLEEAPSPLQLAMIHLMSYSTDLEGAADVIDNMLLDLASKKHAMRVDFSVEGWRELEEIHIATVQVATLSLSCFQRQDNELARKVLFHKRNIRRLEKKFRESHISRLVKGRPETIVTSSIHMDVLGEYRRLAGLLSNHVYTLVKEGQDINDALSTDPTLGKSN